MATLDRHRCVFMPTFQRLSTSD